MDCSMPGFPVLRYFPEFAQTHVLCVNDAIQPSHPLVPFSSCPQSFPSSGSFVSAGQNIGAAASTSVLPVNIQGWFPLGLTVFIFLYVVQGTLRSLFQHHSSKASVLQRSAFFMVQLSHAYRAIRETIALTIWTFVSKVMSLLLNMLSSKEQVSFNFMAAVTVHSDLGAQEKKICCCFHFLPIYLPWRDGTRYHDLGFWMLNFKPAFSLSSLWWSGSLFPLPFLHIWGYWYFSQQSWFQLVLHPVQHFTWYTLRLS